MRYDFASDNCAGMAPEARDTLLAANSGYVPSYGDDAWTQQASDLIRDFFETDCEVFFCFNGTASNSLALASLCQSYHSIICHEYAHIETDECGAPEFYSNGTKVLLVPGARGKIDLAEVGRRLERSDLHFPKPRAISVTQPTELGTIYTIAELDAVHEVAQRNGLRLHMDGARFLNAVAAMDVAPKELSWRRGVDVLCLGGTKLGMPVGDAVVFFNKGLAEEFEYRCKQAGQLASKMRFLTAPWVGMLKDGAWRRHASHANSCAQRLAAGLSAIPGARLVSQPEANAVFVHLPPPVIERVQKEWAFYTFIGDSGGARLMCSWSTTDSAIDELLDAIRSA